MDSLKRPPPLEKTVSGIPQTPLINQGFCVILDIDMYGLPRPSRLRQQAGFLCVIVFLPYILILLLPHKRMRSHTAPHDPDVRRSPCRPHTFLCSFYPSYRSLLINCPVRSCKAIAEPFSAYPLLPCLRIPLRHRCRSAFC